jgi:hypothetical protein
MEFARSTDAVWDALETAIAAVFPDEHIEKAGFALEVVKLLCHIQAFLRDHPAGIRKYDASRLLRQLSLATSNDTHSDRARLTLAAIERDYELGDRAHPALPRFDAFRDAIAALGQLDRLQYQDDSSKDSSDAVSPTTSTKHTETDTDSAEAAPLKQPVSIKTPTI